MKKLIIFAIVGTFIAIVLGLSQADSFNPGSYPLIYRSSATAQATPTAGSGVITTGKITAFGTCEFYNSGASSEWYTIYDSATVATQKPSNALCITQCAAGSVCSCSAAYAPIGPAVNAGLVAQNGLTWGSSKAIPGPTASPDPQSLAICNFMVK